MSETLVTYELWYAVKTWATANGYTFANAGEEGNIGTIGAAPNPATKNMPVTFINWRDAIIFSNAITQWYNAKKGTSYTCVYYTDAAYTNPIKIVTNSSTIDTSAGTQDNPYVKADATGFRLPSSNEFELAARYKGSDSSYNAKLQNGYYWTPGSYASGATADYNNAAATQAVSWYGANSDGRTHQVDSANRKIANTLGLFDMSGNAWEWTFDWFPIFIGSMRVIRGGSWYESPYPKQVGDVNCFSPYITDDNFGFRLSRSAL
jgi:formylglycine-generating enzyme